MRRAGMTEPYHCGRLCTRKSTLRPSTFWERTGFCGSGCRRAVGCRAPRPIMAVRLSSRPVNTLIGGFLAVRGFRHAGGLPRPHPGCPTRASPEPSGLPAGVNHFTTGRSCLPTRTQRARPRQSRAGPAWLALRISSATPVPLRSCRQRRSSPVHSWADDVARFQVRT